MIFATTSDKESVTAAGASLSAAFDGRLRLGALLLRDGLLTPGQLEEALAEKEATGERLGTIVVRRGWVSERALAEALAEQHGLEYLDLASSPPNPAVAALLAEKFARRLQAVPVRFLSEETVLVAVADPTNVLTSDNLRMALGLGLRLVVSELSAIDHAIARAFAADEPDVEPDEDSQETSFARVQAIDEAAAVTSAPAIRLVNRILRRALAEGASDLHFEPRLNGLVVRARVDGVTRKFRVIPRHMQQSVVSRLKIMGDLDIAERRAPQDGRVAIELAGEPIDLRIAVMPTTHGEQVVLRIGHRSARSLDVGQLGMAEDAVELFRQAIDQPYGAVIACGPTGSGKTTTLYAALELLNREERVLMTIEDPAERRIPGVNQVEVNPRAGLTFAKGLRTILRSDPDVLLVGEIRDDETARIAVQAAMTGHLVLTTLHAHNAAGAIARLREMGVDPSLLASSVNCIVAQRLARRLCPDCREAYPVDAEALLRAGIGEDELPAELPAKLYRARGCTHCAGTGYRGRVALYEIMQVRGRLRRLVARSADEIFAAAVADGMRTLRQDGLRLCFAGISSLDEIRRVTGDRLS
jgi:type IV pilus assembly protein PilB